MKTNPFQYLVRLIAAAIALAAMGGFSPATAEWAVDWTAMYHWDNPAVSQDEAGFVAVTTDGIVVSGTSSHERVQGYYFYTYDARFMTVKYNQNGQQLWTAEYAYSPDGNHIAEAQTVDAAGNVYVTGGSWNGVADYDYATVKYSPNGEELWSARWAGPVWDDIPADVAVDEEGHVYVTGESPDESDGNQSHSAIVKYDADGTELWAVRLLIDENGTQHGLAVVPTADDAVYAIDNMLDDNEAVFVVVTKFDADGVELWQLVIADTGGVYEQAAALDRQGNLVLAAGYEIIKIDADGNVLWTSPSSYCPYLAIGDENSIFAGSHLLLEKHDSDGQLLWSIDSGDSLFYAVEAGAEDSVWAAGIGHFSPDSPATAQQTQLAVHYDADGIVIEQVEYGSTFGAAASDVAIGTDGRVLLTGEVCQFGFLSPHGWYCYNTDFLTVQFSEAADDDAVGDDDTADDDTGDDDTVTDDDTEPDDDAAVDDDAQPDDDATADDDTEPTGDDDDNSSGGCA